jgi:tetratricopeptide (TPR) repeat protein
MLEDIRATEGLSLLLLLTLAGLHKSTQSTEQYESCCSEAFERLLPHLLSGDLPEDSRSIRSWLYCLGVQLLQNDDQETVRIICQRGLQWFPDYPPISYLSGFFLKLTGFLNGSIPYFQACLAAGHRDQYFKGEPFDHSLMKETPAFDLGEVHLALSHYAEAITAFELALSFDPNHTQAREQLAVAQQQLAST